MKYLLITFVILCTFNVSAQKISPQVISSTGDIVESTDIHISWTLGEFSVATIGTNPKLTQGFQQSNIVVQSTVEDPHFSNLIAVFPNPVEDVLNVQFENAHIEFAVELIDAHGKILQKPNFTNAIRIQMNHLPSGNYYLRIRDSKNIIHTSKIIKL